jgi:DNA-binding MarR family transcriptional regulator
MKVSSSQKILNILEESGAKRPADLARELGVSPQALHRQLKKLLKGGQIRKKGRPPLVFYELAPAREEAQLNIKDTHALEFIEENFSYLTSSGELTRGAYGFQCWLKRTKQLKAAESLANRYYKQHRGLLQQQTTAGLYDITQKLVDTFPEMNLTEVCCSDFYSLPQFGKTHLGNLITAGKSGQSQKAIHEIASTIGKSLSKLVRSKKIDAVAWAPHSIKRQMLFLPELKSLLGLSFPEIELVKVFAGDIPIAQKSLSKLSERIENAQETIVVNKVVKARNVLLIDDAVGSGGNAQ